MEELTKRYGGVNEKEMNQRMTLSQNITLVQDVLWVEKLERYSNRQGKY